MRGATDRGTGARGVVSDERNPLIEQALRGLTLSIAADMIAEQQVIDEDGAAASLSDDAASPAPGADHADAPAVTAEPVADDIRCRRACVQLQHHAVVLVDKDDELLSVAMHDLRAQKIIGVDCEGVNLDRTGELCVIQVSTPDFVYVFDVCALRKRLFDAGLRAVLESTGIEKVLHDCRSDSDALWHQYGVRISFLFDTQVADVMLRHIRQFHFRPRFLAGFSKCIAEYLMVPSDFQRTKSDGRTRFQQTPTIWASRPLPQDLVKYAAADVVYLLPLRAVLRRATIDCIYNGSSLYASMLSNSAPQVAASFRRAAMYTPPRLFTAGPVPDYAAANAATPAATAAAAAAAADDTAADGDDEDNWLMSRNRVFSLKELYVMVDEMQQRQYRRK